MTGFGSRADCSNYGTRYEGEERRDTNVRRRRWSQSYEGGLAQGVNSDGAGERSTDRGGVRGREGPF